MPRYKAALYATGAALACSVALNITHYTGSSWGGAGTATGDQGGSAATPSASGTSLADAALRSRIQKLEAELEKCRQASWKVVSEAIKQGGSGKTVPPGAPPKPQPGDASGSSFARQQQALCDMAKAHTRAHWLREKENIMHMFKQVGTDEFTEQDIANKLAAHQHRYSLSDSDVTRLETSYQELMDAHAPNLQRHINDGDWSGLIDVAKDYWREEDKLVSDVLGHGRKDEHRGHELGSRTAILAIIATLAGKPWDETIAW